MEINELDTWEYWEEKFKGMSETQIKQYWIAQMEEAEDMASGMIMDAADGMPYGSRAAMVREEYKRYKRAKEQHEEEKAKRGEER